MHLNQRIVNLSTPLTHPRFFALAEDLAHQSQALFRLITDDGEAFRRSQNDCILHSKGPKTRLSTEGRG